VNDLRIIASDVSKRFSQRPIFRPISFQATPGEIIAITGPNGAGKSTLLKIIGNVLSPTKGTCDWMRSDSRLDHDAIRINLGFVAPYLELYDELTAFEHVRLVADLKGLPITNNATLELLDRFGLDPNIARGDRRLRAYSSGMKQRVRCAMAIACEPAVLLLDEPTSNLDDAGTELVLHEAQLASERGAIVFIATNDARERSITHREICIEAF
jgi:heme exporter protein A